MPEVNSRMDTVDTPLPSFSRTVKLYKTPTHFYIRFSLNEVSPRVPKHSQRQERKLVHHSDLTLGFMLYRDLPRFKQHSTPDIIY